MKLVSKTHMVFIIFAVYLILLLDLCDAQEKPNIHTSSIESSLRHFLQTLDSDKTSRYTAAFRDLNGDRIPEVIVYLLGKKWCGSGGCNTLILKQNGNSWKIITKITITRPPIRVLATTYNGWHSIGVWVQGGGVQSGYEAELRFDGKTYPRNPTIPPARRLEEQLAGEVVISSEQNGIPLY